MSYPNIPNITPTISLSTAQTVPLLLASIALEELSLAHIMNAEAEKLQLVLGTLTPTRTTYSPATVNLSNLLTLDSSVQRTLRDVIKKEMLLEFKFENVLELISLSPPTGAFCECAVTYNISNSNFFRNGVNPQPSDLARRDGQNVDGRGQICGSGTGNAPCDPAIRDLFGFQYPRGTPTVTFLADQYFLNANGSVGSCCRTATGGNQITITGTGSRNGVSGITFTLILVDGGGGNNDSATLILSTGETFTAINTINPGQVMIRSCSGGPLNRCTP